MPISITMGTWWLVRIKIKGNGMWWIRPILLLMKPTTPPTFVFSPLLNKIHYERIGWFVIGLLIWFLNCVDHLQLHCNSMYSYNMNAIGQTTWFVMIGIHHMWNHIHMQFVYLNCNYGRTTIVQLQCN
jgi:hypothetical protein